MVSNSNKRRDGTARLVGMKTGYEDRETEHGGRWHHRTIRLAVVTSAGWLLFLRLAAVLALAGCCGKGTRDASNNQPVRWQRQQAMMMTFYIQQTNFFRELSRMLNLVIRLWKRTGANINQRNGLPIRLRVWDQLV